MHPFRDRRPWKIHSPSRRLVTTVVDRLSERLILYMVERKSDDGEEIDDYGCMVCRLWRSVRARQCETRGAISGLRRRRDDPWMFVEKRVSGLRAWSAVGDAQASGSTIRCSGADPRESRSAEGEKGGRGR